MEAFLKEYRHLKIPLEAIKSATADFDNNKVIGKGGFGKVYEGVVSHSKGKTMVAFKRLDRSHGQGDPEFWKEILMLSRYTHENLISLLGFCDDDGEKILVYEHAFHGSLDRLLSSSTLSWMQRLKICVGAAKGLCYLHDPRWTQQRVLHRDIKSSNILIDENWNAKVSDMGLSKIGPADQRHTFLVSNVVGTFGYIDPIYMETGILTKESDVYSFGVVLFEVLCGRLCYENNDGRIQTLGKTWKKSYKQKKLDDIIIQDLKQHMDPSSLKTFSDIAYRCLKKSREKRPYMYDVVETLELALRFQLIFEGVEPPTDYEDVVHKSKTTFVDELIKWVGGICMWRNPMTTVLIHILFMLLVVYPELLMTVVFILVFAIGIWNFRYRTHMNTFISQLDVQRNEASRMLTVIEYIVTQGFWIQSLLSWRDPRASTFFVIFCLVTAIVTYVTPPPPRVIALLIGMYMMRHPRFRGVPMPFNLF